MATRTRTASPQPEQLSLLTPSEMPLQFRLDRHTRERGLTHIAEIRRLLAARSGRQPWVAERVDQAA